MKTQKLVAWALVLLGFAGCKPDEPEPPKKDGLPRCQPGQSALMYGVVSCYWESRATMPEWLEPSESAVLFLDEIQDDEDK